MNTNKLEQNPKLPKAFVVDLDGTLAIHVSRGPFELHKCYSDEVNQPVYTCLRAMLGAGYHLIFVSGREDICKQETMLWLADKCGLIPEPTMLFNGYKLFMRKAKDNRKDSIVKEEIYRNEIIPNYYVEFVLDDRNQVVDHLRALGLTVFQVAPGDF